jgi:hypothetical protein
MKNCVYDAVFHASCMSQRLMSVSHRIFAFTGGFIEGKKYIPTHFGTIEKTNT